MTGELVGGDGLTRLRIERLEDPAAVARLSIARAPDPSPGGAEEVDWALCYGGIPVVAGVLLADEHLVERDLPHLPTFVDDHTLTLRAWAKDGRQVPLVATCRRPPRQLSAAERLAINRRPAPVAQDTVPTRGRDLVAYPRPVRVPGTGGDGATTTAGILIVIYQDYRSLLEQRKRRLRDRRPINAARDTG